MIRVLFYLSFVLMSNPLSANSLPWDFDLSSCFNMNEVGKIGKQISELLKQDFCEKKVEPSKFAAIGQELLSKIMTESFLGIPPPENWQLFTDDMIENCFKNNDLCTKLGQEKFEECVASRVPLILIQFGPWLAENCIPLNHLLIQQWSKKAVILRNMMDESKMQKIISD